MESGNYFFDDHKRSMFRDLNLLHPLISIEDAEAEEGEGYLLRLLRTRPNS